MIKEALLYETLATKTVLCHVCQRQCHIEEGKVGYCRTRINSKGKLFSTIFGMVSSFRPAPIEIKPIYHYLPGSHALSLGSLGCNFLCDSCQNFDISFALVDDFNASTTYISIDDSINLARENNCQGISWTYNEPTIWFEYTFEGARKAKSMGLYTSYVTNGYMTLEALDLIGPYLDVFCVNIKAFDKKTYKRVAHIEAWEGILEVIKRAKKRWKMHIEVVTNLIPGVNEDLGQLRELAQWIKIELGRENPWHITRFFPRWKMVSLEPTPVKTLERVYDLATREGLEYVYIGNVPMHSANNTYCPSCGGILITRSDYDRVECKIRANACPSCKKSIPGRFI